MKPVATILLLSVLSLASWAQSTVPLVMSYQGYVTDPTGAPLADGNYAFRFRIYTQPTGGAHIWEENHPQVAVSSGLFNVILGSGTPVQPLTVAFDQQYYLATKIGNDPNEVTPRVMLTTTSYAFRAREADGVLDGSITNQDIANTANIDAAKLQGIVLTESEIVAGAGVTITPAGGTLTISVTPVPVTLGGDVTGPSNANVIANDAVSAAKIAPGQVVKSLNTLHDDVTLAAGTNVTITPTGNTLTINAAAGGFTLPYSGTATTTTTLFDLKQLGNGRTMWLENQGAGNTFYAYGKDGKGAELHSANNYALHAVSDNQNASYIKTSGASKIAVWADAVGTGGKGVHGRSSGNNGFGVIGEATGNGGIGVQGITNGTGANVAGVVGSSNTEVGVRGSSSAVGKAGIHGEATNTNGIGVEAIASGVDGIGVSSTGWKYGVEGVATGNNGSGVIGTSNSGTGAVGVSGHSNGGTGVKGSSLTNIGVWGSSNNANGAGVFGENAAGPAIWGRTPAGGEEGVVGEATASSGIGVFGRYGPGGTPWTAPAGVKGYSNVTGGTGVFGEANNGAVSYGVWGMSTNGYAGYFTGNLHTTGNFSCTGTKAFKIDHPLDPENKYLLHSCVESPDMMNIYNGVVVLDADGSATVALPSYFEVLNDDYRYQLTCIGGYAPVYISQEIRGNRFSIAGGRPGLKVSWEVTGIRQDPYAKAHPMVTEVEKPAEERGTYIHPELYGMPEARGLDYRLKTAKPEMHLKSDPASSR